jgi:hypothetical protein
MMRRPSDVRLLAMVQYINSLGLKVYGPDTNLRNGEQGPGCMDFTPRQVISLRKLKEDGKLRRITAQEALARDLKFQRQMEKDARMQWEDQERGNAD